MAKETVRGVVVKDPPVARLLFSSTALAWVWFVIRTYVGYVWIKSSLTKLGVEAWTGTGLAVKGFWERAIAIPEAGRPPIAFDWSRSFLSWLLEIEAYRLFGKLIAYGEVLVGIALVLGAFVGLAAFFGAFMNWNFMMAGTASTNPVMFTLAVLLILAWKTAGHYGLDRYLLPLMGTPWQPGKVFRREDPEPLTA